MKKVVFILSAILAIMAISPIVAHAQEQISEEELGSYIQKEFEKMHIPAMSVEIVNAEGVFFANIDFDRFCYIGDSASSCRTLCT